MERGGGSAFAICAHKQFSPYVNEYFAAFKWARTTPKSGSRLQNTSFCILPGEYCHNVPSPTSMRGVPQVSKAAQNAFETKPTKNCTICGVIFLMSAFLAALVTLWYPHRGVGLGMLEQYIRGRMQKDLF